MTQQAEWMMNMNANVMSALAEPNRLQIVELLRDHPLTVGEIAGQLQLRQPQASKHLRVLSEAGIVEAKVDANRRIYSLRPDPFRELDDWLESYRSLWEERFDRLDDYLKKLQDSKHEDGKKEPES
jgi:DNA-binding transcriptional ArsR family regulator